MGKRFNPSNLSEPRTRRREEYFYGSIWGGRPIIPGSEKTIRILDRMQECRKVKRMGSIQTVPIQLQILSTNSVYEEE